MVALVVTIVVLLILSTITIQEITHTGLFSSAENAKLDYKRGLIANTLETKLKISQSEQIRGTDEQIIKATYEDVKNDLEEIKKAGGKNIEVGEVTSDEKDGRTDWFFEVKVDGDVYKVTLDGSDFLGKEDELAPLIQIKTTKATTNTITVNVTTKRNEGGKVEYYIKEKAASKFTLAKKTDQNEYTYTGLKQDTTFVIKAIAIGKNGKEKESKEVEIETSTVPKIDSKEIEFAVEPNTWTNQSVKVTAKPKVDTQGFTLVTSKNPTSSWTKVNNQTFSTNGTMYVALTDGNNYGVTASHEVTNIDKIKPVITSVTATTNTIKITATDDASGISAYAISESSTMPTKFTVVDSTKIFNKIIENKKQSTKYYVWVKDQAGNVSEVASTTTGTVAGLTDANTTFSKTPNDWTNKDVTVTASTTEKNFALQTKKDNGEWQTTGTQTFTENGTIYARLWDGINAGTETKLNVTNIDKLAPNTFTPKTTVTTNSIKVEGTTTDATATSTNGSSGIKEYRFSKDGGKTYTNAQTSATYTFSGLTQNVEYTIVVEAKDNAGNTTTGTVKATTGTVPTASGATYTPTTWTKGNVTVTLPTKSGYSTVYTTNGTAPTKDSTKYSAAFTVSSNCKINYLYTDGTNIGGAGTVNVTNIDKLAPNTFTPKITVTTNSIKVDGTTTDATATSTNGSSGIKEYRFSKDGGKTYTNAQTSATYTFSGLTQNVEYTIVVEAKDNAGNTTTGTVKATTGTVPTASGATYTPTTWTKGNVTVTLPTKSGYSTVYTTNGTAPTKDSTKYSAAFTVSSNCKINYLYTDGTNIGGAGTVNVTNIDKTAPTFVSGEVKNLTTTGYDVYVYGITDTQSGVNRVQFPTWTNANGQDDIQSNWWYPSNTVAKGTKQADGTTWVYHVNIKDHKNEVGLYYTHVYVYDNLGNSRCVFTPQITVPKVPDITSANASFSYNPKTWTSGSVRATASTTVSGYYLQTSTDAQTWKTQNYVDRTTNGAVYARLTDGVNVGNYVTGNVGNIDKTAPTTPTLTAKIGSDTGSTYTSGVWTNQAVIITATSSDTQSQINRIEYSYDNSTWNTNWGTSLTTSGNNKSIKGTWGTNYNTTVYVRAVDNAGNVSGIASIVVRHDTTVPATPTITAKVGSDTGSAYTSGSWTSQPIIITATSSDTQSQINRIEYSYNNSSWSTSWGTDLTTNGNSKSIKGTWNGNYNNTVYVRAVDNVGNVSASSSTVIREDATAPTINTGISGTATSKSITLSLVASDNLSGVNRIVWYYKDSTASSYTSATDTYTATTAQTTRTHTFTNLTHDRTYNAYAVVYDAVGRTTQSSTINVSTVQVPNLATTNGKFTYSTTNWTNGNVTATASTTTGGYSIQTSTDASNWSTNASISRSSNGKVYARLWDGKNAGGYLTGNISNIDKTNISISSFTASPSSTIATVATLSATVNDANSGLSTIVWQWGTTTNYGNSSTSTYTTKNGATAGTTGAVTKTFSLTGLSASTTYYVKMTAYDVAGNANTSTTSFTTGKAVAQVGSVYYTSAQNAVNSIATSGTVTMIADTTETRVTIPTSGTILLKMNDKTINGVVWNNGNVTIEGKGKINGENRAFENHGTATIKNVEMEASGSADSTWTVFNVTGTLDISNSTIKFTGSKNGCALYNYSTLNTNDVNITSNKNALVSTNATVNIKNGTFNASDSGIWNQGDNGKINGTNVKITGKIYSVLNSNSKYSVILKNRSSNYGLTGSIGGKVLATTNTGAGQTQENITIYNTGSVYLSWPTWTTNKGQDDIKWGETTSSSKTHTYTVKKSDHKNETGVYEVDIYTRENGVAKTKLTAIYLNF